MQATINKFIICSKYGINTTITRRQVTYEHTTNPLDNRYDSALIYLYKYIVVNERYMRTLIYFTDNIYLNVYDSSSLSYTYDGVDNS